MMDGITDPVESALRSVASSMDSQSTKPHNEMGKVMKEVGAPSNNMLLNSILSESKRCADETAAARVETRVLLGEVSSKMTEMCELLKVQNKLLSSQVLQHASSPSGIAHRDRDASGKWYYHGSIVDGKNKMCACIIMQFMEIIRSDAESRGVYYPDSVDAKFNIVCTAVTECSKIRCDIPRVDFKAPIEIPDFKAPGYQIVFPLVASPTPGGVCTTLSSQLKSFLKPQVRPVMVAVDRLITRLKHLKFLFSEQQYHMLQSIRSPPITSEGELNFDPSVIVPAPQHPNCNVVMSFSSTVKKKYIILVMGGTPPQAALVQADGSTVK